MRLINSNSIIGIFPRKGEKHYKRVNQFGKVEWLDCKTHKPAFRYSDSYLTVDAKAVHPDDLPKAKMTQTQRGEARLFVGMRLRHHTSFEEPDTAHAIQLLLTRFLSVITVEPAREKEGQNGGSDGKDAHPEEGFHVSLRRGRSSRCPRHPLCSSRTRQLRPWQR